MGNFKYYNYIDTGNELEISGTPLYPYSTHLIWEHSTYGLYFVRHDDQTKLVKTTNEGATDCINIDLTSITSKKIQVGWLDGNDLWLVCCDQPDDEFTVLYVEMDNSDNIIDVGDSVGQDAGTVYVYDIFKIGTDMFVFNYEERTGTANIVVWDIDTHPFIEKDTETALVDYSPNREPLLGVVIGTNYYATFPWTANNMYIIKYTNGTTTISFTSELSNYGKPNDKNTYSIAYDGSNILYMVGKHNVDGKNYLVSYSISGNSFIVLGKYDVALMSDRNVNGTNPPFNTEKAFHLSEDKVFVIGTNYKGVLQLISTNDFDDTLKAVTDNYLIDASGNLYQYEDVLDYIIRGDIFYVRQHYPVLEMAFNSDYITINPQQSIHIIGPYTANGSTTATQIVFEGIAETPSEGRIQYVRVKSLVSEIDTVKPYGSKSGRTDQIISDINDDGAPNGPSYIVDGTLSNGEAMGTITIEGAKTYREVINNLADMDAFTWYVKPTGELDYNNGTIDSSADIKWDGTTVDTIIQVRAWKVAKLNQIIINGAIDISDGKPYEGKWDDIDDQQENGVNSITIEDSMLNSDALCQTKADNMGASESERTRVQFKFRKTSLGIIQVGQTITFKYIVTNYMTITEAQFVLDKLTFEIRSEVGYAEISSSI